MKNCFNTLSLFILLAMYLLATASGQASAFNDYESLLPPLQEWSGASEALIASADDDWITPAERTGLTATPDYDETLSLIHISEPTRLVHSSRMPSSA